MQPNKQRVPARHLLAGDQLCTGETIAAVARGARTPSGKVEVTLDRDGVRRVALWGASTTISVVRSVDPVAAKVETLGTLVSELARAATTPNGAALLAAHADKLIAALTVYQLVCSTCIAAPRKEVVEQTAL
jgi:hypothetical protein